MIKIYSYIRLFSNGVSLTLKQAMIGRVIICMRVMTKIRIVHKLLNIVYGSKTGRRRKKEEIYFILVIVRHLMRNGTFF
jgi:hypothetical protein